MRRWLLICLAVLLPACSGEKTSSVQSAPKPVAAVAAVTADMPLEVGQLKKGDLVSGRVMKVTDGDTLVISSEKVRTFIKCRLYGIDAPEIAKHGEPGQPYGEAATKFLKKLVLGQMATVTIMGQDRYRRQLALVEIDGLNVNFKLLEAGYAWAYREYLNLSLKYQFITAETEARTNKRGLWQEPQPEYPHNYRKRMKKGGSR